MTLVPSRAADLDFCTEADRDSPDANSFLGHWKNTNPHTFGILELAIELADTGLSIRIWGAAVGVRVDWGVQQAEAFACVEENAVQAASLYATYNFGFMTTELQLRLNKGILPLMSFSVFHDDSGRSNYHTREFFYRSAAGGDSR